MPGEIPGAAEVLARAARENFPVALRVLTHRERRHLLAIYGFARLADAIGDECPGDRSQLLDWLDAELDHVYRGAPHHALTRELARSVRDAGLPEGPFRRLIEANRADQRVSRYATWAELEGYCELSAHPVGHLVLRVFGADTPAHRRHSDRICSALQLVEHCQDVAEDFARGRVYLPAEDLARFGCAEAELGAARASAALRRVIRFEVSRARALLDEGTPLVAGLRGRARWAVAGFAAGGRAALRAIERRSFDVLAGTPRPRRLDVAWQLGGLLWGRLAPRPAGLPADGLRP